MADLDILVNPYAFGTIKAAMEGIGYYGGANEPPASIQIQHIQKARNHAARHRGNTVVAYGKIRCRTYPNH